MPRNAIATQAVQCVVPIDKMSEVIKEYIEDPDNFEHKLNQQVVLTGNEYSQLFNLLMLKYRVNFNDYKPTTISRRVDRRVKTLGLSNLNEYIIFLQSNDYELETLHRDLLIGVTAFFRDKDAFNEVKNNTIPFLFKKFKQSNEVVRIWVPACSTGEEVYSIAILLLDYANSQNESIEIKIFATDVSKEFLELASQGVYSEHSVKNIPKNYLNKYFKKNGHGDYQVTTEVRNLVVFSPHNLITDPPFTKMDLISCRNFLIYVQPSVQHKILSFFKYALNAPGYLFLGSSETLGGLGDEFESVSQLWKLFKKVKHVRFPLHASSLRLPSQKDIVLHNTIPLVAVNDRYNPSSLSVNMYHEALSYLLTCGFLVDSDKNLLHIFGDAADYVKMGTGNIQHINITSHIVSSLKAPLNTAFHKAKSTKKPCSYKGLNIETNGNKTTIRMTVQPLQNSSGIVNYYLVSFKDDELKEQVFDAISYSTDEQSQQVVNDLERELQETRESLQATIEEVETTNEELQSTNEELLASNEELQSTNEELHSVNEELYTVNSEHQKKIEELTRASTDIDNILRSTSIGAIFVDKKLLIRFFTPSIAPIYSLVDTDIGRSINNFTHVLIYNNLIKDTKDVIQSKEEFKLEVQSQSNSWYLLRILPYLTDNNEADGAIITLVDITDSKLSSEKLREADERLNLALRSSDIGIWVLYSGEYKVEIDNTIRKIYDLDYKTNSLSLNEFINLVHPEDRKKVEASINESVDRKVDYAVDYRIIRQDKSVRIIAARGRMHHDLNANRKYITGVCWDITERVRLENQAIEFEGRKVAMDDITDGWWDWNLETNEEYLSPKFKAMFGYEDHEIPNTVESWRSLLLPEDLPVATENFNKHIKSKGKYPYIQKVRYRHKNGSIVWVICRGKAIADKSGKFTRMIGTHTDITQLKEAEKQLNILALHDPLTKLPNRNSFMYYLPRAIKRAKKTNSAIALLYIDLDNFKQVNDTLGHSVGDILLRKVTERLQDTTRTVDFLGRIGGDEFAIILEEFANMAEVGQIANRCVKTLSQPFIIEGNEILSSLSVGVAVFPSAGDSPEVLLKNADIAMYRAKESGKNKFAFYDEEINKQVQRQQKLEIGLHKALEDNSLELYYQPQFICNGQKLVGIEALVRWHNKELGNPMPDEFIPVAELSQIINPLGKWIINQALLDYKKLMSKIKQKTLTLSVNVSALQISNYDFVNDIEMLIKSNNFNCKNLVLEITESGLMKHIEQAKVVLEQLKSLDINVALDDFGIGYSSMQYLKHFPISCLKIDQSFVRDINKDESDMAIIKAIISIAKNLNILTIAEGVETQEQQIFLQEEKCDQIQGFLYAKPMPLKKLIVFINQFNESSKN